MRQNLHLKIKERILIRFLMIANQITKWICHREWVIIWVICIVILIIHLIKCWLQSIWSTVIAEIYVVFLLEYSKPCMNMYSSAFLPLSPAWVKNMENQGNDLGLASTALGNAYPTGLLLTSLGSSSAVERCFGSQVRSPGYGSSCKEPSWKSVDFWSAVERMRIINPA